MEELLCFDIDCAIRGYTILFSYRFISFARLLYLFVIRIYAAACFFRPQLLYPGVYLLDFQLYLVDFEFFGLCIILALGYLLDFFQI